jgi:hypothetical protein
MIGWTQVGCRPTRILRAERGLKVGLQRLHGLSEMGGIGEMDGMEDPNQVGKENVLQAKELAVVGAGAVDSEASFAQAVWAGIEQARQEGLRELTLCDPHFAFWPLSQERVLAALTVFVKLPGRRLVLVAQGYDHLRRRHPRFLRWRAVWGHAVTPLCFQDPSADLPSVLLADRAYALRLHAPEVWSGAWVSDRQRLIALVEQVALLRHQSHPDLPINLTGL